MAAELPRPGVEVIQSFRTTSPTVVTPTLVPCVVGVCKQVVDVLVPASSGGNQINSSALVSMHAVVEMADAAGNPPAYTGLDGLNLVLSILNGPDVTITFVGNSLSPAAVVEQVTAAFSAQGVSEAFAEKVGDGWRLVSVGVGEFQSIEIKNTSSGGVLSAFGLLAGYIFYGSSYYDQFFLTIPQGSFPDPRGNLSELSIEADTIRVFFGLGSGTSLRELSRTTALLRKGGGGTAAALTGTVSLGTGALYGGGGSLDGKTLIVAFDAGDPVTIALGTPADKEALLQTVNAALGGIYATDNTGLKLESKTTGTTSRVRVTGGSAQAALGFSAPNNDVSGQAGVQVVDDGNGDALSPLVKILGEDFTAPGAAAVATGLVDLTTLTYPADLNNLTLKMGITGRQPQTLTFSSPANAAAVVSQINTFWAGLLTASLNGSNHLVLTTDQLGEEGSIEIVDGTALNLLGLVPSVLGAVSLLNLRADPTVLNGKKVRLNIAGTIYEHTFSGLTNISTPSNIASNLNGTITAEGVAEAVSNKLRVRAKTGGAGKTVTVLPASSAEAATYLGFDVGQTGSFEFFEGTGFPPISGDDLYVDGVLVGRITQVAPGAVVDRVRIDKQLTIAAAYGELFFMVAKNLSASSSTRPTPELVVDSNGTPQIKANLLRDTTGTVLQSRCPIYLSYRAVREDVTAKGQNAGLLKIDNTDQLDTLLSPVSILNPLALGLYFALLNAPGAQVTGLGVDAVSADAPFGTVEAFTRAAEYLEAFEVYAIAPLTHDESVAQVFNTHVTTMSEPANKGERICLFNFSQPSKKLDTLVASGLTGNSLGTTGLQFDTGVVNLAALALNAGINPVGTIDTSKGLFLDIASDSKRYSIESLSGGVVTIRTSFAAGENDDGFYAETDLNDPPLPSTLINEPFAIRIRGAALTLPDSSPDKQGIAETYQALGQSYMNRRFWSIVPDRAAATLNGLEQVIDGFYLCAGIAGAIGQQPPQQSFTNFPMPGYTRAIGSNDYFTEKQLNIIAAGGNYIVVKDAPGAPLTSRMALTTDMTSVETRTDSITKVVDFTAKFLRRALKNFIGRFNITQGFLDSLGHVTQGLLGFLSDLGVLIGANMNNIVQDENAPDSLFIDVTLDVPFPCNYIHLTLVI